MGLDAPLLRAAYLLQVSGLLRLSAPAESAEACREAAALMPRWSEPYLWLAPTLVEDPVTYDEALAAAKKAVELEPWMSRCWSMLADVHWRRREYPEALAAVDEALRRVGYVRWDVGTVCLDIMAAAGRIDEAVARYEAKAERATTSLPGSSSLEPTTWPTERPTVSGRPGVPWTWLPGTPACRRRLALLLWDDGRPEEAAREMERAIELSPTYEVKKWGMSLPNIYIELGRWDDACDACLRALKHGGRRHSELQIRTAFLLTLARGEEAAWETCREAFGDEGETWKSVTTWNAWLGIAQAHFAQGDLAAARRALARGEVESGREGDARGWEATLFLVEGDFDRAARNAPDGPRRDSWWGRAWLALEQGRYEDGALIAKQRLREHPGKLREGRFPRPRVETFQRYEAARHDLVARFERLAALASDTAAIVRGEREPRDREETLDFADLCLARGRYVAAARYYQRAAREGPLAVFPANFRNLPHVEHFLQVETRFRAVRAAVLAGTGAGPDAHDLSERSGAPSATRR